MNNIRIWVVAVKKILNFKLVAIFFVEYLVIFLAIFFLTNYNIILSFILLVILMIVISAIRLFLFYKKLMDSDSFDQILLKPIDPLFALIVYKMNIADIVILLPVLIFIKFRKLRR